VDDLNDMICVESFDHYGGVIKVFEG